VGAGIQVASRESRPIVSPLHHSPLEFYVPVIEPSLPSDVALPLAPLACKASQVAGRALDVTEGVGRRILELAKAGKTSPDRLCTDALRELSH
jgi:hypothetical protein